jgi:hypothetical protein
VLAMQALITSVMPPQVFISKTCMLSFNYFLMLCYALPPRTISGNAITVNLTNLGENKKEIKCFG